jgi:cyclopropane-fatty-acyl-phospholipid synthase
VIEIGTGWGGFACYAAQHYGCKVTTTTISKQQYHQACLRVKELGLEDKVTVLEQDYRLLEGQYDKLVSIEMIEAVGHQYYSHYFRKCSSLLKPDGQMLIQAILMNDQRYDEARKSIDFIKRYIFPGGCLPSYTEISKNICKETDLQMMNVHDITYDYALTLSHWREKFLEKLDEVKTQGYQDTFIKMWEFYLCYCQGGFMERTIHTAQIVFAKPKWRDHRYPGV